MNKQKPINKQKPMNSELQELAHKGIGDPASLKQSPWHLLAEDVSLPAAVVYQSKLVNNLQWMQRFAQRSGAKLAPHGKTTMTPEFFRQQIAEGAWAITLATVNQVAAACQHGITRVLMANQLVGKRNMGIVAELLPYIDFYCLVDSVENVHQLGAFFSQSQQPLKLLIEIGVPQGRCGCRTGDQVMAVSNAIAQYDCLKLTGIEIYEGVIHGENAAEKVSEFLSRVIATTQQLANLNAFDTDEIILTGAGSAWYDLVAESFSQVSPAITVMPVMRPGCYLVHDQGIYQAAQAQVMQRSRVANEIGGALQSALEVWAYVQSLPEPGLAVIGMGKRDVAFDAGLPQPALHYRPGSPVPQAANEHWQTTKIMDQHTFVSLPLNADIKVGDIIAFSTSHPCLTFDKWRRLCVIDDNYVVIQCLDTCF